MASGTKRLPRAVREQQMLDAAISAFAANGFADTSMDAIAAEAKISKPMLYLYYGSKDELFSACIARESGRFMEAMSAGFDPTMRQKDQARTLVREFLRFVYQNSDSWRVLYRVAVGTATFAHIVTESREGITSMITDLIRRGTTTEGASDVDFELTAVALVGAGEAVADRIAEGDIDLETATDLLLGITWRGLRGVGVSEDAVGDET
ncbi:MULTISPECIES: TetR/AcrR family transcriptional regulator [Gordonia]|uniref:TetR/AcrR family transcriptional regulator n=2 Tax=Gordonia TaxID=2053 RepID=A0ABN3HRG2_9ACTN|nr:MULTISPECIES: TetR/AcrR family transcriptional regulator [Gordonia]AUH67232.1 TetR/AcrR family transcriptional regulator [Gordonia sp. YC-JH1]KJR09468.1 TetR family transcriptional regulator [Gordonia sihwensis]KXT58387.1 TetR family transcriptional regulator [Gordonia sp. QH-12]MBY4568944.1 TetR family transcriptional regulator [Gordonia sihwensis]WFN93110.1 TetR/AcrR family transcriptional regulator [Gordonia sihwensis]